MPDLFLFIDDGEIVKCFACKDEDDLFDRIKIVTGLTYTSKDYRTKIQWKNKPQYLPMWDGILITPDCLRWQNSLNKITYMIKWIRE